MGAIEGNGWRIMTMEYLKGSLFDARLVQSVLTQLRPWLPEASGKLPNFG